MNRRLAVNIAACSLLLDLALATACYLTGAVLAAGRA